MIYGCEEKENEADFEVQKAVKDIYLINSHVSFC